LNVASWGSNVLPCSKQLLVPAHMFALSAQGLTAACLAPLHTVPCAQNPTLNPCATLPEPHR
jgi:hypothetical protein